jgi:hypothetical protein
MSHACHCCNLPKRLELDRLIVEGKNLSKLSKEFGVPYHSIYAHAQHHITRQLATVMEKKAFLEGDALLETIQSIITRADDIFTRNYKKEKDITALKALAEIRSTIQLLSNIASQLHSARIAELQLAKDNGEGKQEQYEREFAEKLVILSTEELKVFIRLQNKVLHQNADIIISNRKVLVLNCNEKK